MTLFLTGIGFVLVVEGLVIALLPARLDTILKALEAISLERRRMFGLAAVALGVLILWLFQ